jgi:anhydro-N-acetylmuramic acid kinase
MHYKVIGLMSGSSLDGLDIAYVHFTETAGNWQFSLVKSACIPYSPEWKTKLSTLHSLSASDYLLLHTAYGHYLGALVNIFLEEKQLAYQVQLIVSHGHTAFHMPDHRMTAQLGDGAAIAAVTGIRTITDLRSVDIALGGQGAPIVPIGEKLLLPEYDIFLNIGGIANLSARADRFIGFDVCPANRILNMLSAGTPRGYDENGDIASSGKPDENLLLGLNAFPYYELPFPKSLSNDFGVYEIYPLISGANLSRADALATYCGHIVFQISKSLSQLKKMMTDRPRPRLLITGGGAHNQYLVNKIRESAGSHDIDCVVAEPGLADYKEALIMAFIGVLRWREDINVMCSVTGASKDSINGAVWSV